MQRFYQTWSMRKLQLKIQTQLTFTHTLVRKLMMSDDYCLRSNFRISGQVYKLTVQNYKSHASLRDKWLKNLNLGPVSLFCCVPLVVLSLCFCILVSFYFRKFLAFGWIVNKNIHVLLLVMSHPDLANLKMPRHATGNAPATRHVLKM